jgi:hypothetical protein
MTVDIWIRDYNPPMCFQKKISGRSKHNALSQIPFYKIEGSMTRVLRSAPQYPARNPLDKKSELLVQPAFLLEVDLLVCHNFDDK